jgi:hypothetical protein
MKGDWSLAYPPDLVPFYLLFAMKGQTFYEIVSDMFIFPCWRTLQRMKEKFLQDLGFTASLFDGNTANLVRICELSGVPPGSELILAVGAADVGSYVRLRADGKVEGMITTVIVTEHTASILIQSDEAFHLFLKERKTSIMKFAFVYATPIGPHSKAAPIQLIKANSGTANQSLLTIAPTAIHNLRNLGFRIRSLAFDEDGFYLGLVDKFYEYIRARVHALSLHVGQLADGNEGVLPIED